MEQEELQEELPSGEVNVEEEDTHHSHHEREERSKALLSKMKINVKVIKWLVISAGILAGLLLVYGILLVFVFKGTGALVGFIVLLVLEGLLFVAFFAMFIYTQIILKKLKKK